MVRGGRPTQEAALSCYLGVAEHSSVMSKVLVSSYISEADLGSRFDERIGNSKT
jgi:hypothetical protein